MPELRRAPSSCAAIAQTVTVVCEHCLSVLDANDPDAADPAGVRRHASTCTPQIPLGTRGKLRRHDLRSHRLPGAHHHGRRRRTYCWHEYLLFNPYKGFRYLTEYDGHWNDVSTVQRPAADPPAAPPSRQLTYNGETYTHFQTAQRRARRTCSASFPGRCASARRSRSSDYVAPPLMLSSEETAESETTWSLGEYMQPARGLESVRAAGLAAASLRRLSPISRRRTSARAPGMWPTFTFLLLGAAGR